MAKTASVTKVPLLDLTRSTAAVRQALIDAAVQVLDSGQYIMGPAVGELERACAQYVGARHALGVSSGTDALLLALMALDVGAGDEVICPTYTFFATAGTIARTGAKPVFVDCLPCCYCVDPRDVERKITQRTKAIIPVHLFGQCADMTPIMELAEQRNIAVVEDAAQAIGARYKGRGAGAMGAFGCFSFFPSKNLGAFGDAGLVTCNDDVLADKARTLRLHGGQPKYYHKIVGGNFRIDTLQAALLHVKLPHLDDYTRQRQVNARRYADNLVGAGVASVAASVCRGQPGGVAAQGTPALLPPECQERHIYNQFTLRLRSKDQREGLRRHLGERHIGTEIYYPVPLHLQDCFAKLGHRRGEFPVSELAADTTLALPIFPELTPDEVDYVSGAIVEYLRR